MRDSVSEATINQPAFDNFRNAYAHLIGNPGTLSIERYYGIHRRLASGGIENVKTENLGRSRREAIVIDHASENPFTPRDVEVINSNPYLRFEESRREDGRVYGELHYPDPRYLGRKALRRVELVDAKLAETIRRYQEKFNASSEWEVAPPELTARMIDALVRERINWFESRRAQLGEKITSENLDEFLFLVAEFHKGLISIHPFEDVNGRSTRVFALYDMMAREGIPPPRLHRSSEDINVTVYEFAKAIRVGMERTEQLYAEMVSASLEGRGLEDVARIFFPALPEGIDGPGFLAWAKGMLGSEKALRKLYLSEPHEACDELVSRYAKSRDSEASE